MGKLLSIEQLSIYFRQFEGWRAAVNQVNFELQAGQCLGLVGESGSGKSLSALAIMQLLPAAARVSIDSRIYFADNNLLSYSERAMRRVRGGSVAMIFQDALSALNPVLSIGQQMREILYCHQRLSKTAANQKSLQLLADVGISDPIQCLRSYPHELSGGMRQRAMIAMALSGDPQLLIADEPTTALDVTLQARILALLKQLVMKKNIGLLFISHDLSVVSSLADDVVVLQQGRVVESAKTEVFFQNPKSDYSRQLLKAVLPLTARQQLTEGVKNTILRVDNLCVTFPIRSSVLRRRVGETRALAGVNLDVGLGETVALVGESGSGKTTLAKAAIGLTDYQGGVINFSGELRRDMQIIFQDPLAALNPRRLVGESIIEGLLAQQRDSSRRFAIDRLEFVLKQVQLDKEVQWKYPHELSGGQRQRVCIARALALMPKLLILDEPTSALDVSVQLQILDLLLDLQSKHQLAYLLITHNLSVVAYMAHRMVVLHRGKVVESGATAQVLAAPEHEYTKKLLASVPEVPDKV